MSAHKSPYDPDVYEEWHAIVFSEPPMAEEVAIERWAALFARTYVAGRWTCNADSAGLVISVGWGQAMRAKRYGDAEALCRLFLAFDRSQCDEVCWGHEWFCLGSAIFMQGRVREAIGHWDSFEPVGTYGVRIANLSARNDLYACLYDADRNQPADPDLRTYVSKLLLKFKGCKRAAAKALLARLTANCWSSWSGPTKTARPGTAPVKMTLVISSEGDLLATRKSHRPRRMLLGEQADQSANL